MMKIGHMKRTAAERGMPLVFLAAVGQQRTNGARHEH
jgi:hypothetical protein